MQLRALRLFLAVARHGSFVAAAERENTVQSNVTAHVKKLEGELGVCLFDRRPQEVRLTPAGRRLLEHAEAICDLHDEAVDDVAGRAAPRGPLRIGAMETTAAVRLPRLLSVFQRAYPDVDLVLSAGPTAQLLERFAAGELDGAFVAGPPPDPALERRVAFSERLVLISGAPLNGLPDRETLASTRFFAFRQGCSYRQRVELLLARKGLPPARVSEFGSLEAIVGCVAAGLGFAVLPACAVEPFHGRHTLYTAELGAGELAQVDTYFVSPAADAASPALKAFTGLLEMPTAVAGAEAG